MWSTIVASDSPGRGPLIDRVQREALAAGSALPASSDNINALQLVACGLLDPAGDAPQSWRFGGASLGLTRRALRLMQDLGVNAPGAAVAIELLDRIDRLERGLR